jgi:hypothetical protein
MSTHQGDLSLLDDPVARQLLQSRVLGSLTQLVSGSTCSENSPCCNHTSRTVEVACPMSGVQTPPHPPDGEEEAREGVHEREAHADANLLFPSNH